MRMYLRIEFGSIRSQNRQQSYSVPGVLEPDCTADENTDGNRVEVVGVSMIFSDSFSGYCRVNHVNIHVRNMTLEMPNRT